MDAGGGGGGGVGFLQLSQRCALCTLGSLAKTQALRKSSLAFQAFVSLLLTQCLQCVNNHFLLKPVSSCPAGLILKSGAPRLSKAPETSRARKAILVHLYLTTEKCTRLKPLIWREPLFILRIIMWIKQPVIVRFEILLWLCGPEKFPDFRETWPRRQEINDVYKHFGSFRERKLLVHNIHNRMMINEVKRRDSSQLCH